MGRNESNTKRKIHSIKNLHKEIGKISHQLIISTPESSRTKETNTRKRNKQKERVKLSPEINYKQREEYRESTKLRVGSLKTSQDRQTLIQAN